MLRLCFERIPGCPPIEAREDFISWFEGTFPNREYQFGGYLVCDLGKMWFNQNVLWTVLLPDMDLLERLENEGWMVNGYAVHAFTRERGENEMKIDTDHHRISAVEALNGMVPL